MLHGEVGGLGAFENLVHVRSSSPPYVQEICPVGHQTPGLYMFPHCPNCWQPAFDCELEDVVSMIGDKCVPLDNKAPRTILSHGGKDTIEIITSFDPEGQKRYAQCAGSGLELFQLERARGASRIPKEGDARGRRDNFLEKFQPFGDEDSVKVREPRDVPAGPGEAPNETFTHRIR